MTITNFSEWINIQPGQDRLSNLQNTKLDIFLKGIQQEIDAPVILSKHMNPDRLRSHVQHTQKIKQSYFKSLAGRSDIVLSMLLESIDIADMEIEVANKRLKNMADDTPAEEACPF